EKDGNVGEDGEGRHTGGQRSGGSGSEPPLRPQLQQEQLAGRYSGGRGMMVVPEDRRLQWIEVVEDAGEVTVAVVPTPYHLALLSEDGRLRLYDIVPRTVV
ncbi:hypothetical protein Vafri_15867, partial [Volvox africanus]